MGIRVLKNVTYLEGEGLVEKGKQPGILVHLQLWGKLLRVKIHIKLSPFE